MISQNLQRPHHPNTFDGGGGNEQSCSRKAERTYSSQENKTSAKSHPSFPLMPSEKTFS